MAEAPAQVVNERGHGTSVRDHAEERIGSPDMRPKYSKLDQHQEVEVSGATERLKKMENAFRTILECINENPDREGLVRTPARAAKAMMFFTKGYEDTLESAVSNGIFQEEHNDMVIVKGINMFSLCEHHLVPFYGTVSLILQSHTTPPFLT
jgi:GTP cyclohydrolase I